MHTIRHMRIKGRPQLFRSFVMSLGICLSAISAEPASSTKPKNLLDGEKLMAIRGLPLTHKREGDRPYATGTDMTDKSGNCIKFFEDPISPFPITVWFEKGMVSGIDIHTWGPRSEDEESEQAGAGQPASRSESDLEGGDKPHTEAEGVPGSGCQAFDVAKWN